MPLKKCFFFKYTPTSCNICKRTLLLVFCIASFSWASKQRGRKEKKNRSRSEKPSAAPPPAAAAASRSRAASQREGLITAAPRVGRRRRRPDPASRTRGQAASWSGESDQGAAASGAYEDDVAEALRLCRTGRRRRCLHLPLGAHGEVSFSSNRFLPVAPAPRREISLLVIVIPLGEIA